MRIKGRPPKGHFDPLRSLCAALLRSAVEDGDRRFLDTTAAEQMATFIEFPITRLRQAVEAQ